MPYVFDTNSFLVLRHYFPERFPTFWERFDDAVNDGQVISVREVRQELEWAANQEHLEQWINDNRGIFLPPSIDEMEFVKRIFAVPHFQQMISERSRLKGVPVADPFVIASAACRRSVVVSEEQYKPNAARIPNVCEHFDVPCTDIEGFMRREGWRF